MLVAALTSSPALVAPAVAPLFAKPKLALAPHSDALRFARMEEAAAAPATEEAEEAEESLGPVGALVGDVGFDPLGFTEILPLAWLREAEIKHCRTAMLATFGFAFTDFWHFPGFDYTTLEAHDAVIAQGGMSQLLLWIGLLEVFSAISIDQMLRGSGREPGDYGFDPLGFASDPAKKADLQMKELANGRLAMFAFGGFVTQSVLTGNTFPYLFDYQTAGDIVAIAAQGASP
ncbi:light harvesting protein [Emiliania huxleyi CCMP1516]|uniref:Light harvesting protein n=2 Tax=Emiliania huxleyi TaxID=2903 RepID=A0A0D3JRC1_EMIH1|nr:light harvesting protein [Emiliania huxleyi CCMP1516]EOD26056.1 light harvesting protein [Emiliania huxleyi CCMP1516]|eukprot:XP_005778485.1 light harvesting protein [Emiliania huxleyi CCMP1516]